MATDESSSNQGEAKRAQLERIVAPLRELFEHAPSFVAVLSGPEHRFELTNRTYDELVGRSGLIGQPVSKALPEVVSQGFLALLDEVFATGEPFVGHQLSVILTPAAHSTPTEHFVDFVNQPLFDDDKAIWGIFVNGVDVTSLVQTSPAFHEAERRLKEVEDELAIRTKSQIDFLAAMARDLANPESTLRSKVRAVRRSAVGEDGERASASLERHLAQLLLGIRLQLEALRKS